MRLVFFVIFTLQLGLLNAQMPFSWLSKSEYINYQPHKGIATLQSGQKIEGTFKFLSDGLVMGYNLKRKLLRFTSINLSDSLNGDISFDEIKLLTLEGHSIGRVQSYAGDSTRFIWSNEHQKLLRVVLVGEITLYDNSFIVTEWSTDRLDPSPINIISNPISEKLKLYAQKKGSEIIPINKLVDLKDITNDRPYFLEQSIYTGKSAKKDLEYITKIVKIYNSNNPLKLLNWKPIKVHLTGNNIIQGWGVIQSSDINQNRDKSITHGIVHYYNGQSFQLLTQFQVLKLEYEGAIYHPIYVNAFESTVFVRDWQDSRNTNYKVFRKLLKKPTLFNYSKNEEAIQFLIENEIGEWVLAKQQVKLRSEYLITQ